MNVKGREGLREGEPPPAQGARQQSSREQCILLFLRVPQGVRSLRHARRWLRLGSVPVVTLFPSAWNLTAFSPRSQLSLAIN